MVLLAILLLILKNTLMKKVILSFGAYILLASFNVHPGNNQLSAKETIKLELKNGRGYTAQLTGVEQPDSKEPYGSGRAFFKFNPGQGTMYYYLEVNNIETATYAAIYFGAAGETGPVVAELQAPVNGMSYTTINMDKALIKAIMSNPENYYVSVSNALNPDGAVRGQIAD
jgi:hypothetical protein